MFPILSVPLFLQFSKKFKQNQKKKKRTENETCMNTLYHHIMYLRHHRWIVWFFKVFRYLLRRLQFYHLCMSAAYQLFWSNWFSIQWIQWAVTHGIFSYHFWHYFLMHVYCTLYQAIRYSFLDNLAVLLLCSCSPLCLLWTATHLIWSVFLLTQKTSLFSQ